jgi:hypothetical protein
VRWTANSTGPRWTADRGHGGTLPACGVRALELTDDGGEGRAGRSGARELLTSDGRVAERWRTEGNDRWRLELVARAKEGAKGLGKEGMRCGESRGSHRPFIGAGGAPERGGRGSNDGVNGVNANEGGGEVKTGIKEGEMMAGC